MCDQNVHKKFEEMLREHCSEYHNHKETMAHAALVVQLGLFAWIMTTDVWPPKWVNDICISKEWGAFVGYLLIWLLIFWYTRWQLNNRRRGAKLVAELINRLKERIQYIPQSQDRELKKYLERCSKDAEGKMSITSERYIYVGYVLILILVILRTFLGKS